MIRILATVFLIGFSFLGYSQNSWKTYNNKPVQQVISTQTSKDYKTSKSFTQIVSFYPNGYIKNISTDYGNDTKYTQHYIYKSGVLISILEKKETPDLEEPQYNIEIVKKTNKDYLPLETEKLENYNVISETSEGPKGYIYYSYDDKDQLTSSFKLYSFSANTEEGFVQKIKYDDNNFIEKTFYKDYQYKKDVNDSVFKELQTSQYNIINHNSIGATKYTITSNNNTKYFKTSYNLYKPGEVSQNFKYLKIEDVYPYYLDEIIQQEKISSYTYQVFKQRVSDSSYNKSLIKENALQPQEWYIKKVFLDYISQELENNNYKNYLTATKDALSAKKYFEKEELDEFRSIAVKTALNHKDFTTAEEFVKPLFLKAKKNYQTKPTMQNGELLGLMAKIFYLQNKNIEGDKVMKLCENYKSALKKTDNTMENKIEYHKYNYFLAQVYAAKNDLEKTKQLLEENLTYYNSLDTDYKESETFSTDYTKNKMMLISLNN
ncbi:hypothetical protein SAMN04488096_105176 [Mesonia phycicola]|uniref:Uncharacterized protein n=1 Tax=Mesonia phycicola TaxID=579105 RepID=A0A1M6ENR8_9FLAO|nr:hypothetical protein [Mesonia phycicola]SHI86988.1 hypothetical protein SAMN04488096_105176 [Mesonia phycicola]